MNELAIVGSSVAFALAVMFMYRYWYKVRLIRDVESLVIEELDDLQPVARLLRFVGGQASGLTTHIFLAPHTTRVQLYGVTYCWTGVTEPDGYEVWKDTDSMEGETIVLTHGQPRVIVETSFSLSGDKSA